MLAVDTNVLVRFLVDDDPAQSRIARKLVDDQQIRVPDTVLLETEWVLRSVYAFDSAHVHAGLMAFVGLPNVLVERPERIAMALDWFAMGMDFGDAMHLASCADDEAFATFDRKLAIAARKAKAGKVKAL
jgi:predicted nucleic-acid-binding protein